MVRAGGSASRIIGDQGSTDPGGGVGSSRRRPHSWQLLVGCGLGSHWALEGSLGRHWEASPRRIVDGMTDNCWTALNGCWEVGIDWCRSLQLRWMEALGRWFPRCPELGKIGGGCSLPEGFGRVLRG